MSIVDKMYQANEKMTVRVKESFMYQIFASRAIGGRPLKALKEVAIQSLACHDTFDISDAVNELIRERKVKIQFIGGDPYLWLERNSQA